MSVADWAVKNKAILMAGVLISAVTIYLIFDVNYEECDDKDNCLVVAFEV